jgi:hypothetical protein
VENDLSSDALDRIEHELRLMNVNLAEANDIAMLAAFRTMPPELDYDSRQALTLLRDRMMKRARDRADSIAGRFWPIVGIQFRLSQGI